MKLAVSKNDAGQRLDKFLTAVLNDKTRSQIKKLITQKLVLVNDQPAKVHQFLKAGDVIEIRNKERGTRNGEQGTGNGQLARLEPKIIFETPDYVVLDKPSGLLVHPTEKNETNTLTRWLLKTYTDIKNIGEDPLRPGIVQRLDRDVSGVMVVVKNQVSFTHLKNQFKNRAVEKYYTALVYGRLPHDRGVITLPIGRNKAGQFVAHPRRRRHKLKDGDRVAKTFYRVIEYIKDYTLLEVRITTGRTHQIRAHLHAIGHPILGDQIYKPKRKIFRFLRRRIKVIEISRIFLHAARLTFADRAGEKQTFTAPLPPALTDFINVQKTT